MKNDTNSPVYFLRTLLDPPRPIILKMKNCLPLIVMVSFEKAEADGWKQKITVKKVALKNLSTYFSNYLWTINQSNFIYLVCITRYQVIRIINWTSEYIYLRWLLNVGHLALGGARQLCVTHFLSRWWNRHNHWSLLYHRSNKTAEEQRESEINISKQSLISAACALHYLFAFGSLLLGVWQLRVGCIWGAGVLVARSEDDMEMAPAGGLRS